MPDEVDRILRERANERGVSLNQQLIDELTTIFTPDKSRDLSDLVGQWAPDQEFDAALDSQREINPDDWS